MSPPILIKISSAGMMPSCHVSWFLLKYIVQSCDSLLILLPSMLFQQLKDFVWQVGNVSHCTGFDFLPAPPPVSSIMCEGCNFCCNLSGDQLLGQNSLLLLIPCSANHLHTSIIDHRGLYCVIPLQIPHFIPCRQRFDFSAKPVSAGISPFLIVAPASPHVTMTSPQHAAALHLLPHR